jgi:hypothetical protein
MTRIEAVYRIVSWLPDSWLQICSVITAPVDDVWRRITQVFLMYEAAPRIENFVRTSISEARPMCLVGSWRQAPVIVRQRPVDISSTRWQSIRIVPL